MKIVRGRTGTSDDRTDNGTVSGGGAWGDPVLAEETLSVYHVFFEPRARTHWHRHERGQLLIVTSGRGLLATREGDAGVLEVGDSAWIPPGEEHWHGGAPASFLMHTAVSLGEPQWLDAVSDEDYERAAAAAGA